MPDKDYYIGLMSGTSADAIDAALVDFSNGKPVIVNTLSLPVPDDLRQAVFALAESGSDEINTMRFLDREYAGLFSSASNQLCDKAGINQSDVTAIGSHGQTIRHYPATASQPGYSLQVGDPNIIAERTGITTVADFRRRDIAAGGQGAPLAPAFHEAFFRSKGKDRIILNLGGIANITWLPKNGETTGFDTGPANTLMDAWCQLHTGQAYDINGQWAASGKTLKILLDKLLKHTYLQQKPPKSTGRETFNLGWLKEAISSLSSPIKPEDVQASLLDFTVETIAKDIERLGGKQAEVYCCGGGSHNQRLMEKFTGRFHTSKLGTTAQLGIAPDWVEAVAFAWLAKQALAGQTGNIPSVTGAKKPVTLGGIYPSGPDGITVF